MALMSPAESTLKPPELPTERLVLGEAFPIPTFPAGFNKNGPPVPKRELMSPFAPAPAIPKPVRTALELLTDRPVPPYRESSKVPRHTPAEMSPKESMTSDPAGASGSAWIYPWPPGGSSAGAAKIVATQNTGSTAEAIKRVFTPVCQLRIILWIRIEYPPWSEIDTIRHFIARPRRVT